MEKKRKRRRLGQRGFTFVELLVAVAILGVCVAPIVSTFIVTARINLKGRQKEQALTVAQNIVEGVKAFGIEKTMEVCDSANTGDFKLLPENPASEAGSTKISHAIVSSTLKSSTIVLTGYEYWKGKVFETNSDGSDLSVEAKGYECEIKIENILSGYAFYDAVLTISPKLDPSDKEFLAGYAFESEFKLAGTSNLKYYDITVKVNLHGQSDVLASYDGTFTDLK